ncbi:PREDICTED: receptor-type tyrosine-protein phosphatase N2 isoform X2 [Nicrophorus vespilloides]|uniref:Receptor-type tyrosine-protein phosphatase N2 isoform X2 n=1 Tax=Nicrophorus vespilloides TaxID=110193 RepID=A0ABM1M5B5_NICVS|nr:PREDICTED: receptor-type tyrosine-protein phosphatase N2 isoform X2 [Nicrophorus vespilloides]
MLWPSAILRCALLLFAATVGPPGARAEGYVGCLFSDRLCLEDVEFCFDDFAFGRCLQTTGQPDEDDFFRFDLDKEALHDLSHELKRLFALGYRWSHSYTQCRLQGMLFAYKNDLSQDVNACSHLSDQDLEGALKALEGEVHIDPRDVAIVKFTPSADDPRSDFADEVYYPPVEDDRAIARKIILPSNAIDLDDMPDPYADYIVKRTWIPQMRRRSPPPPPPPSPYENPEILDKLVSENRITSNDVYALNDYLQRAPLSPENYEEILALLYGRMKPETNYPERIIYNSPENFRTTWEPRRKVNEQQDLGSWGRIEDYPDDVMASEGWESEIPESRVYFDEDEEAEEYGSGAHNEEVFRELKNLQPRQEIFRELKQMNRPIETVNGGGIFTEGGMVYLPSSKDMKSDPRSVLKNNLDELLQEYDLGFKRPERLDVKKPGPPFDTQMKDIFLPSMMKKEPRGAHPNRMHEIYDVDTDYVYVAIKDTLRSWRQGDAVIRNISSLLNLNWNVLSHGRVDRNEVTFKVNPNPMNLNATDVATKIWDIKDQLKAATGVEIVATGVGDKTKEPSVVVSHKEVGNEFYIIIFTVCGILIALIIASILLLIIRKHVNSKEKLNSLARPDSEASKDYQDLCRARMSTKGTTPAETVHGRITSLSRESEQSPSSRSSTSSWSEEPALHNMDISTGHMVLSYMEDHLKNKDRLEQEWVALCAYVAEPCESSVALKKENVEKNRYMEVMPYDHARVVLNDLTNLTGSDFINASSITDHDPRNPAYIAAQGPLPQTAPDFWQLIWEQGAVVIVMLTRLTEGGTAMCHRYWPEEGSEVYHIYEVHLVSEHIWCDDYLVRSFYLKNVRTGETRTVTQFHFLSWPETGVPASTKALLEFRRKVNKSYRGRSCPIVVHCSDGAGRTGTYCLIDMVLSRMAKGAKEIDIAATLEHLRDQRSRMVATKQQFEFVLTAVAEEVHAILKALPPQPTQETKEK